MARKGFKFDAALCLGVLILVGIGVVLIYSSSADYAEARKLPSHFYLAQHVKKVVVGVVAFLVGIIVPYKTWERLARPMLFVAVALLAFLVASGLAGQVNGARRWIQLDGFGLQPSELAKLALIFYLARRLAERAGELHHFRKGLLASLPMALVVFLLILKQPNYSTAATVLGITVAMVFAAGCRTAHLAGLGLVAVPALGALMVSSEYRMKRVLAFFSPEDNPASSYQSLQALISLGHGGVLGTGPGTSTQKLGYLPMPFTDTVFSILGEEFGFVGSAVILLLFGLVVWRGLRVAYRCPDRFGALAAVGLSVSVAVNVAMHVGVCVKLFPTTGQPLPFISYGGTSLLANLFGMGVLLNISGAAMGVLAANPLRGPASQSSRPPANAAAAVPRGAWGKAKPAFSSRRLPASAAGWKGRTA
jgi:cell division protein FtsW